MQNKLYYKKYLSHYQRVGNKPIQFEEIKASPERFINRRPWYPLDKNAKILDFGCGLGHQLISLYCSGYSEICGVDLVKESCLSAKESLNNEVEIICEDGIGWLKVTKRKFNLIICNDILEHMAPDDCIDFLTTVHDALEIGGGLIIRTPNMNALLASSGRYIDFTHKSGFTALSLVQLLENAGFSEFEFVSDFYGLWKSWRFTKPWKGTGIRIILNHYLHRFLYFIRNHDPIYYLFKGNLELYCKTMKMI